MVDAVVAERQNGINADFFNSISTEWRQRVQEYLDNGGSPSIVKAWPVIEFKKKSFLNLYISPDSDSVQGIMLDAMRDHGLQLCPACGELGEPNTLDHYLPKGKFPHFCVTPHNLFPMCDACQRNKHDKTGDETTPRFFLHPYFDVFVAEQVLTLTIVPPFGKPTFELMPSSHLTVLQHQLVQAHVRELAIVSRYARYFRAQHRRLLKLVDKMRASGLDVATNLAVFKDSASEPCMNSWDYVFYDSILSNPEFMNFLQNEQLPPLP